MNKQWGSLVVAALVAALVSASGAVAVAYEFTIEDFEDFGWANSSNTSLTAGQIGYLNNGPGSPIGPNDKVSPFGNTNAFNYGTVETPYYNTGWGDWGYNGYISQFGWGTKGATNGPKSMAVRPGSVPHEFAGISGFPIPADRFTQNLAFKIQLMGPVDHPNRVNTYNAFMTGANTAQKLYLAYDITWDSTEWTANTPYANSGFFNFRTWINNSGTEASTVLSTRTGFQELGVHDDAGTVEDPYEGSRGPNLDTGNSATPGGWDPVNYPGIHTRQVYYDLTEWVGDGLGSNMSVAGQTYNLRDILYAGSQLDPPVTDPNGGWIEIVIGTAHDTEFDTGIFYVDNFRLVDTLPVVDPADADFDDDTDVDADDIDILADMIFRGAADPGGQDTADLDGVGGVNQDDMDYMINTELETVFGDADLDDDVDGADFDAWRIRDSLGGGIGWATGDWDGDNDVDGADFDHWRLRLPAIGGGGVAAVPEPATLVLMGLAVPALGLIARRRK